MYGVSGFSEAQMNSLMSWSPKSRMAGNYTHMKNENLVNLRQQHMVNLLLILLQQIEQQ